MSSRPDIEGARTTSIQEGVVAVRCSAVYVSKALDLLRTNDLVFWIASMRLPTFSPVSASSQCDDQSTVAQLHQT
jgi:hypothetical protein